MKTVYISGPMRGIENYNYNAFHQAAYTLRLYGHSPINPAGNFHGDQGLPWETYMATDITQVLSADAIALLPGWQNSTGALVELAVALATGKEVMDAETLEPIEGLILTPYDGTLGLTPLNFTPGEGVDECCGMDEAIGHACYDCPYVVPECCGDPGDCYCDHWVYDPPSADGYTLDDDDYVLEYTLSSADDHPILTPGEGSKKDSGRGGSRSVLEEAIDITSGARQASYGHPSEHYERTAAMWTAAFGSKRGWHFNAEDVPLLYMLDKISREINSQRIDNMVDVAGYARVRQLILEHLDNNPPL